MLAGSRHVLKVGAWEKKDLKHPGISICRGPSLRTIFGEALPSYRKDHLGASLAKKQLSDLLALKAYVLVIAHHDMTVCRRISGWWTEQTCMDKQSGDWKQSTILVKDEGTQRQKQQPS